MRAELVLVLAVIALCSASLPLPRALVIGATDPASLLDVQSKLLSTASFATVDVFDGSLATPTAAQLQFYHTVMVFSDRCFAEPALLGNRTADYIDNGGGVVIAASAFQEDCRGLQGRAASFLRPCGGICSNVWDRRYLVFATNTELKTNSSLTILRDRPKHPLFAGVDELDLGSAYHHQLLMSGCCGGCVGPCTFCAGDENVIARYSNKQRFAEEASLANAKGRMLGLNMFPVSSDVNSTFWNSSSDGAQLLANAMHYVATPQHCDVSMEHAVVIYGDASQLYRLADVQQKIEASGYFDCVAAFDINRWPPIADDLQRYESALVFGIPAVGLRSSLGDTLSAFVQLGGGLVLDEQADQYLTGALQSNDYLPFRQASSPPFCAEPPEEYLCAHQFGRTQWLGDLVKVDVASPVLYNVTWMQTGVLYTLRNLLPLLPGSHLIANWDFGDDVIQPAVVLRNVSAAGLVAGLNFNPVSSDFPRQLPFCEDTSVNYWPSSSDGGLLMANTLKTVGRNNGNGLPSPSPTPSPSPSESVLSAVLRKDLLLVIAVVALFVQTL